MGPKWEDNDLVALTLNDMNMYSVYYEKKSQFRVQGASSAWSFNYICCCSTSLHAFPSFRQGYTI